MRRMGGGLSGGKKGNVGGFGVEGFFRITRERVVLWGQSEKDWVDGSSR